MTIKELESMKNSQLKNREKKQQELESLKTKKEKLEKSRDLMKAAGDFDGYTQLEAEVKSADEKINFIEAYINSAQAGELPGVSFEDIAEACNPVLEAHIKKLAVAESEIEKARDNYFKAVSGYADVAAPAIDDFIKLRDYIPAGNVSIGGKPKPPFINMAAEIYSLTDLLNLEKYYRGSKEYLAVGEKLPDIVTEKFMFSCGQKP